MDKIEQNLAICWAHYIHQVLEVLVTQVPHRCARVHEFEEVLLVNSG
jgi:hypothetical protein